MQPPPHDQQMGVQEPVAMHNGDPAVFTYDSNSGYIQGCYPSDTPRELRYKLNEGAIVTEMNECALHQGLELFVENRIGLITAFGPFTLHDMTYERAQ
eukprot:5446764-Prymnesium_polylepis.1